MNFGCWAVVVGTAGAAFEGCVDEPNENAAGGLLASIAAAGVGPELNENFRGAPAVGVEEGGADEPGPKEKFTGADFSGAEGAAKGLARVGAGAADGAGVIFAAV